MTKPELIKATQSLSESMLFISKQMYRNGYTENSQILIGVSVIMQNWVIEAEAELAAFDPEAA